jgi:RNA polymerase sigma-70 factor, ECF subfamily
MPAKLRLPRHRKTLKWPEDKACCGLAMPIAASTGNPAATMNWLLAEHRAELLSFVRARVREPVAAEDVVQQVAAKALTHTEQLRDSSSGRAWLFRITRNVLADELSRTRPSPLELNDDRIVARDESTAKRCGCVLVLAKTLKPEYSSILNLVFVEGMSVSEAANDLGIASNSATVRLHRARRALRRRLHEHCGTNSLRECADCGCEERGCCIG